jgi:hypothetical protein
MSHSHTSNSAKNLIITAAASFVGMLAALPVAFLVVSAAQPASAMPNQATDASYKQYLQGYTQGYLATVKQDNSSTINAPNCAENTSSSASTGSGTVAETANVSYQPMTQKAWSQNVTNSYNTYTSSTHTTNKITTVINKKHVTNINSNNTIGSNNTTVSQVTVKDSAGAVVTSSATGNGNVVTGTNVNNVNSNNTTNTTVDVDVKVEDSFNTDSHDKTTNVTNNTNVINDSFNHVHKTVNNVHEAEPHKHGRHCAHRV